MFPSMSEWRRKTGTNLFAWFDKRPPSLIELDKLVNKFSDFMHPADRCDLAHSIYNNSALLLQNNDAKLTISQKNAVQKLKEYSLQCLQALFNVQTHEEALACMEQRIQFKTVDLYYVPNTCLPLNSNDLKSTRKNYIRGSIRQHFIEALSGNRVTLKENYADIDRQWGTQYFNNKTREQYRIFVKEGKLFKFERSGFWIFKKLRLTPVDTKKMNSYFKGVGIYAMSSRGDIFLAEQSFKKLHHSSLMSGGMLMVAGGMRVSEGQLLEITPDSGHYKPSNHHVIHGVTHLHKMKVDLSRCCAKVFPMRNGEPIPTKPFTLLEENLKDVPASQLLENTKQYCSNAYTHNINIMEKLLNKTLLEKKSPTTSPPNAEGILQESKTRNNQTPIVPTSDATHGTKEEDNKLLKKYYPLICRWC